MKIILEADYRGETLLKIGNSQIPVQSEAEFQCVIMNRSLRVLNNISSRTAREAEEAINRAKAEQYLIFFSKGKVKLNPSLAGRLHFSQVYTSSVRGGIYLKRGNVFEVLKKQTDNFRIKIEHELYPAGLINPQLHIEDKWSKPVDLDVADRLPPIYVITLPDDPNASIPLLYQFYRLGISVAPVWATETLERTVARHLRHVLDRGDSAEGRGFILLTDTCILREELEQFKSLIRQSQERLNDITILDSYREGKTGHTGRTGLQRNLPQGAKNRVRYQPLELLPAEKYRCNYRAVYFRLSGASALLDVLDRGGLSYAQAIRESPSLYEGGEKLKVAVSSREIFRHMRGEREKANRYPPVVVKEGNRGNSKVKIKYRNIQYKDRDDNGWWVNYPQNTVSHPLRLSYQVRSLLLTGSARCPKVAKISSVERDILDFERNPAHHLVERVDLEREPDSDLALHTEKPMKLKHLERNKILVYRISD